MNAMRRVIFLLCLVVLLLAIPGRALAQGRTGDKFVFGGTWTLPAGETLQGNLIVFGGAATTEKGSTVTGSVFLAGGTVDVQGQVDGNVIATGGLVSLGESAVVRGDLSMMGGGIDRSPGAQVMGKVTSGANGLPPFRFPFFGTVWSNDARALTQPIASFFWWLLRSFLWAALAILLVLFLPRHVERLSQTAVAQPLLALGLGLLATVGGTVLLVLVAITIIGIPVALLGVVVMIAAWSFGIVGVGTEVGRRLAAAFGQDWPLATDAGVGTFVLTLVVNGIHLAVPCVGWMAPAFAGMLGLGAVILTRFGTQPYPLAPASAPPPYVPVIPPGPQE